MMTLVVLFALPSSIIFPQSYDFDGGMSREVLENYLSRSISMANLLLTNFPGSPSHYNLTVYNEDVNMIANINAKFIGRAVSMWGGEDRINNGLFEHLSNPITEINDLYITNGLTPPIFQACIFEVVSEAVNNIAIPPYVFEAFNEPVIGRNFIYSEMLFDDPPPKTWTDEGGYRKC